VAPGRIELEGQPELAPATLDLPADFSAAAFPLVAGLLRGGSDLTLTGIGLNPHRTGLLTVLGDMGASIEIANRRDQGGEPVGDLRVRASHLTGVAVPAERASGLIDDYPILAVAAASASGVTVLPGLGARTAEVLARGLAACGVKVEVDGDTVTVHGAGGPVRGRASIAAGSDPRVAMAFLILGLAAEAPVAIDDGAVIETVFPDFAGLMRGLGADISIGTI
jgi:3-phosphoshikimate 1-carboxyvinyltransferase